MQIYGFDTETTPFGYGYTPELRLWCIWSQGLKVNNKTSTEFRNLIQDLYDDMDEDIVFVAHNLLYDYYFTMLFETLAIDRGGRTTIRILDAPNYAQFTKPVRTYNSFTKKYTRKTYTLTFIDLSNYFAGKPTLKDVAQSMGLPMKLEELGKSLMFKPTLTDKEWDKFVEYCYRDAEICYRAFKEIKPFINGKLRKTAASLAFGDLKERSGWVKFDRPKWIRKVERLAYFGGRSGSNPLYRRQKLKGWKYDVHSMYSSVMYDYKVPTELLGVSKAEEDFKQHTVFDSIKTIFESNDTTALIEATIILNDNCIPHKTSLKMGCVSNKSDEGKLCFNALDVSGKRKTMRVWISIYELYPAVRDQEVVLKYVHKLILYKTKLGMFNSFIDHWYEIKKEAKGAERTRSKLMLNTSYGKFGERKRVSIKYSQATRDMIQALIDVEEIKYGKLDIYFDEKQGLNLNKIGDKLSILVEGEDFHTTTIIQDDSFGACCIVATEITSRARRKLWEEGLRGYEWMQVDTDGVVLLEPMDEDQIDNENKTLGMWGIETCTDEVTCEYMSYGRKDYRCQHKTYLKGVPKRAVEIEEGKWEFDVLLKPKMARVRKLPVFSKVDMTKRRKY